MARFPVGRDIFERVAMTFAEGAAGVALADQFGLLELSRTEWWSAVATGGVMAVLALGKSTLAAWKSKRANGQAGASLDPQVNLAPVAGPSATNDPDAGVR